VSTTRAKAFSVGALVLAAVGTIGIGVFLVGGEQRLWQGRDTYYLWFARTNGLQESATVSLDGVVVGRVAAMRFPGDLKARYVEVEVQVARTVATRIRTDSVARIQTYGLLGDKYIEISSGTEGGEPLPPGSRLPSIDPVDYEELIGQSGDIVADAIEVTRLLRNVLTEIDEGEGVIGRLLRDRELGQRIAEDLASTAQNLESTTRTVETLIAGVRGGDGNLGEMLVGENRIGPILRNLDEAARGARSFTDKLNSTDGTIPRLVNDGAYADRTLGEVERATTSIAAVAAEVRSGRGTLGKLVYNDELHDRAETWLGGGPSKAGGFWRLLGSTFKFFLPPVPSRDGGREAAAGPEPD
jgi:phospholipid/cholesterol/gamma-HCH transport system substrate-binding protein